MKRLVVLLLLVLAVPASAATRYEVVDDCADDSRLQGKYTLEELRDARRNLRSEVAEYTDCADVLRRAELALMARAGGGERDAAGGMAPGPAIPPSESEPLVPASEAEETALREARTQGAEPVALRGRAIEPGSAGFATGAVRNEMPGSLFGALIALALVMTGLMVATVRKFGPLRGGEAMGTDPWRPIP